MKFSISTGTQLSTAVYNGKRSLCDWALKLFDAINQEPKEENFSASVGGKLFDAISWTNVRKIFLSNFWESIAHLYPRPSPAACIIAIILFDPTSSPAIYHSMD